MMKLYDDLYIGIPSGVRITGCVIGEKWTTVRANGNIGIAKTMEYPEDAEKYAAKFVGGFLRDTAGHLNWSNLTDASVGVAAMNAWYNTKEKVKALEALSPAPAAAAKTAYVGEVGDFPVPETPDFDKKAYEALKGFDTVVIASEALLTRALPGLLEIVGEEGNVVLEGYSLPATALFTAFGQSVRQLRGYFPRFQDTVEACAVKDIADPKPGMTEFKIVF